MIGSRIEPPSVITEPGVKVELNAAAFAPAKVKDSIDRLVRLALPPLGSVVMLPRFRYRVCVDLLATKKLMVGPVLAVAPCASAVGVSTVEPILL